MFLRLVERSLGVATQDIENGLESMHWASGRDMAGSSSARFTAASISSRACADVAEQPIQLSEIGIAATSVSMPKRNRASRSRSGSCILSASSSMLFASGK